MSKKILYTKICLICNQEFTTYYSKKKVCDREHHRNCKVCGEDFILEFRGRYKRMIKRDFCYKEECYNKLQINNLFDENGKLIFTPSKYNKINLLIDEQELLDFTLSIPYKDRTLHKITNIINNKYKLRVSYNTIRRAYNRFDKEKFQLNSNTSHYEQELRDYIKENFSDLKLVYNWREYVYQYGEIDIYIPELKLGIEFNGLRWHDKEKYLKDLKSNTYTSRERIKEKKFKNNLNIKVIQVWEDDYNLNKIKELKKLKEIINKHLL